MARSDFPWFVNFEFHTMHVLSLTEPHLQPKPATGAPLFALFIYVARKPSDCGVRFAHKEELLQYLEGGDPRCVLSSGPGCLAREINL